MILEYKTNDCTWNMVDGSQISMCYFQVEDDISKIKEEYSGKELFRKIAKLFEEKAIYAGFVPSAHNPMKICIVKDLEDVKEIEIVVVCTNRNFQIFAFDCDCEFRICYSDGTIIHEYGKPH